MIEIAILVALITCVLCTLWSFVGCEADLNRAGAWVTLRLTFDPDATVGGAPVVMNRVDFTMRRDGPQVSTRNVHTLVAGGGSVIDTAGWSTDPKVGYQQFDAEPQWGTYMIGFSVNGDGFAPETWTVGCDGYRSAGDTTPAYPSRADVVQAVDRVGLPRPHYLIQFSLQPDGTIAGDLSQSAGATVVLSFAYANVNVVIARVVFAVRIDGGGETNLDLTPTSPSPVAFAGGSATRDSADHQAGRWQATVMNAPAGSWSVRCEAYTTAGMLRFPSGQSIMKPVVAPGPVAFDFMVKQGKAEPV